MESKTYILIHGSWHSAWNWHKVTPLLHIYYNRKFLKKDSTMIAQKILQKWRKLF